MVERAPGRRDDDVDAALQRPQLRVHRGAAVDRQHADAELLPYRWTASATCIASSRVGTRTSATASGALRGSAAIACRIGSANAAVLPGAGRRLPEDVAPLEQGRDRLRWMGVGSS